MILKLLPTLIVIEMFLASIPYLCVGKYGPALYWFAAGLLNYSAIYLMPKG